MRQTYTRYISHYRYKSVQDMFLPIYISSVLLDSLLQNAALIPCLFMLRHGWLIFCFALKKREVDSGRFREVKKR